MGSIRPLLAIAVFVVCAHLLLNHGRHRGDAPVLVPAEATPSAPKEPHVSRAAQRAEAAFERHSVHRQMVKMIHGLDRGLVHPRTLSSLMCTRAKVDPPIVQRDQAVGFDCVAGYERPATGLMRRVRRLRRPRRRVLRGSSNVRRAG